MIAPGDVVLVRTGGRSWRTRLAGWAIRLGAGLADQPNAWNHVIIAWKVDPAGVLWGIEGRPGGVGEVDLRPWLADRWTISNADQPKTDEQRQQICDGAMGLLGVPYDWAAIAVDAARAIDPLWRRDDGRPWPAGEAPGRLVCSSLADWLAERVGLAAPAPDRWCTPADWAQFILRRQWESEG